MVFFVAPGRLSSQVTSSLRSDTMEEESVEVRDYSSIKDYLRSLVSSGQGKIWLSDTASQGLVSIVPARRRHLKVTPVCLMKCIKNSVEIKGFDASHDRDAAALCQYFCWLERAVDKEEVDRPQFLLLNDPHVIGD